MSARPNAVTYKKPPPVNEDLQDAIDEERGNLSKADSLLSCLHTAMEYQSDTVDAPYYPDMVQMARELVQKSIRALDSVVLRQRLLRDKVKEEGVVMFMHHPLEAMAGMRGLQGERTSGASDGFTAQLVAHSRPAVNLTYKARRLRLHRRNYGRVLSGPLSSSGASAVCAAGNICG